MEKKQEETVRGTYVNNTDTDQAVWTVEQTLLPLLRANDTSGKYVMHAEESTKPLTIEPLYLA